MQEVVVADEEGEVTPEGRGEVGEVAEVKEEVAGLLIMLVNVLGKRRIKIEPGKVDTTGRWRDRVPGHLHELSSLYAVITTVRYN